MDCPRCDGLMVREQVSDFFDEVNAWRCVNCGAMVDRLILRNHGTTVALKKQPRRTTPGLLVRDRGALTA